MEDNLLIKHCPKCKSENIKIYWERQPLERYLACADCGFKAKYPVTITEIKNWGTQWLE